MWRLINAREKLHVENYAPTSTIPTSRPDSASADDLNRNVFLPMPYEDDAFFKWENHIVLRYDHNVCRDSTFHRIRFFDKNEGRDVFKHDIDAFDSLKDLSLASYLQSLNAETAHLTLAWGSIRSEQSEKENNSFELELQKEGAARFYKLITSYHNTIRKADVDNKLLTKDRIQDTWYDRLVAMSKFTILEDMYYLTSLIHNSPAHTAILEDKTGAPVILFAYSLIDVGGGISILHLRGWTRSLLGVITRAAIGTVSSKNSGATALSLFLAMVSYKHNTIIKYITLTAYKATYEVLVNQLKVSLHGVPDDLADNILKHADEEVAAVTPELLNFWKIPDNSIGACHYCEKHLQDSDGVISPHQDIRHGIFCNTECLKNSLLEN